MQPHGLQLPDPILGGDGANDPEHETVLTASIGLALLVVLDALAPAERLAFVLHDIFGVPFEDVAAIVGRSPTAARQLASRARRRVQGARAVPDADPSRQRAVVDAFLAASRGGDLQALLAILDPDVVLRVEFGAAAPGGFRVFRGASNVAEEAIRGARRPATVRPALVNGTAGLVGLDERGRPISVLAISIANCRIVEIDVLADPERVGRLSLPGEVRV